MVSVKSVEFKISNRNIRDDVLTEYVDKMCERAGIHNYGIKYEFKSLFEKLYGEKWYEQPYKQLYAIVKKASKNADKGEPDKRRYTSRRNEEAQVKRGVEGLYDNTYTRYLKKYLTKGELDTLLSEISNGTWYGNGHAGCINETFSRVIALVKVLKEVEDFLGRKDTKEVFRNARMTILNSDYVLKDLKKLADSGYIEEDLAKRVCRELVREENKNKQIRSILSNSVQRTASQAMWAESNNYASEEYRISTLYNCINELKDQLEVSEIFNVWRCDVEFWSYTCNRHIKHRTANLIRRVYKEDPTQESVDALYDLLDNRDRISVRKVNN